jgi:hypothetical protein
LEIEGWLPERLVLRERNLLGGVPVPSVKAEAISGFRIRTIELPATGPTHHEAVSSLHSVQAERGSAKVHPGMSILVSSGTSGVSNFLPSSKLKMEPAVGFEPTTRSLQNCCSTPELSWPDAAR